jgi:hypothetical protein
MLKEAARMLMPQSKFGYELPHPSWFEFMKEETRYTPDVAKLEEFEYQLYFACDETQRGHSRHEILDGEYKCPGFTQQSFNYWYPETPWDPAVPMETTNFINPLKGLPPIAKIKGEIHKIRPQSIIQLDSEKQNGVQFRRKKVRIIVPYRALKWVHDVNHIPDDVEYVADNGLGLTRERVCVIRAWMYVGIPEYWDKLLNSYSFHAVDTYEAKNRRWLKEYYVLRRTQK